MKRRSVHIWVVAAFLLAGPSLFAQTTRGSGGLTNQQQLAREIFKELIEINTSVNVGCTKAAEALTGRLKAAGFPARDVALVGPNAKHLNLVARYPGKGLHRPVLFIGHLDVVEARPVDWSVDPFTFLEKDGYFYGRGTTDMKCDDAEIIANFIRLRQEGFIPDRDIIVALTDDEESGDANGVRWLIGQRRDLIDAEYCINLDAGGGDIKRGKHVVMALQTSEKLYADITLETTDKGGHSSLPGKENAIYRLSRALLRIAGYEFPIRLNETTQMFFARSALQDTGQVKADLLAMNTASLDTAAAIRLAKFSPQYNAMLRTTCVATMIEGGHAPNALPQRARANVNCRMLPDDTFENVMATLTSIIADTQVAVSCANPPAAAPRSPLRKDVMDTLERITTAVWPGVVVSPVMSTGASDGKALRSAGMPVYGISGMFGDVDDVRAHGKDERIGVQEFYEGVEFMYRFIKAVTSGS
jgi:acetylornithine deacetylase/succinyl-diaminopimelate desuccinylase-like protein